MSDGIHDVTAAAVQSCSYLFHGFLYVSRRDRGATLRLGEGGGSTVSDSLLGGTRHFFLLALYNFKNIGGRGHVPLPSPPPATRSQSRLEGSRLKWVGFSVTFHLSFHCVRNLEFTQVLIFALSMV